MGYILMSLPSLRVVLMFVLATILIVNTSTTNARCASLSCVDVNSAACRFCNRRAGKRSEDRAWRQDGELDNSSDRGLTTSECYLDSVVSSLPQDLQEHVFKVVKAARGMKR